MDDLQKVKTLKEHMIRKSGLRLHYGQEPRAPRGSPT